MTCLRTATSAVLSSVVSFLVASASGCGSDAVGVDACRDIERARCEAGDHCGFVEDVDECKRFYRDHCLHGLKSGKEPGDIALDECVKSIEKAGACAKEGKTELALCDGWNVATELTTPCDVVKFPQQIKTCEFLGAPVEAGVPTPDSASDAPATDSPSDGPGDTSSEAATDATGGG